MTAHSFKAPGRYRGLKAGAIMATAAMGLMTFSSPALATSAGASAETVVTGPVTTESSATTASTATTESTATAAMAGNKVNFPGNDGQGHEVTFDSKSFMVDGERLNVWSGEFHHWRLPGTDDWRDMFQKMRASGFNAVSLYFFWGLHSTEPGQFDFTGIKDIDLLLTMAEEEGLYVIARPGPYVNAEISMGGLPAYLTKNGSHSLRSMDPEVLRESLSWLDAFNKIAVNHQVTDGGGSIVTYQAENELLNEGGDRPAFMEELVTKIKGDGITVPVFHNDWGFNGAYVPGSGTVGGDVGLDYYAFDQYPLGFNCSNARGQIPDMESRFRARTTTSPMFIAEGQGGAFTPWGANFNTDKCAEFVDPAFTRQYGVNNLNNGINMFNYYMQYGGTNWGWTGSPSSGFTSYDYGAPINEDRQLTPKAAVQKELGYFQRDFEPISNMVPQNGAPVTVDGGAGTINSYQRIATENLDTDSVSGNGARYLGFRQADSNTTTEARFTVPLTLSPREDVIETSYTTDDRDTDAITYTGTWGKSNGEAWAAGNYKGTETFSDTTGDSVEYKFTGAGIRVIAAQSINHGYGDVYLDGVKVGQTNTYRGQNANFQYVAFQQDGLDASVEHTLKIVVTGQKDAASSGTNVTIDAFDVIAAPTTPGETAPEVPADAISFARIPQKAGTFLQLHGRDANMVIADYAFNGQKLMYSTSELFTKLPVENGTLLVLNGAKGDDGETVLQYASEPQVATLDGTAVESTWDAAAKMLRLNYVHGNGIAVRISGGGAPDLTIVTTDRSQTGLQWTVAGAVKGAGANKTDANKTVMATGVDLLRSAEFDGDTVNLVGDTKEARTIGVYAPAGVTKVSWNGAALATTVGATGQLVADLAGPAPAVLPELTNWKVSGENPEAAADFDDSAWLEATATTAANTRQGPGPNQGKVLDTAFHGFYEGDTWYRAHFTASSAATSIQLQGQGGSAANMLVWVNGTFAGAAAANGSMQTLQVPAGVIKSGEETVVSAVVRNQGQNLDWSDDGLSRQNRGLFDAVLPSSGAVTWKLQGAKGMAAPVDTDRTMYNTGGLYGERAGWYLPDYPDSEWADATDFKPAKAGVTWYRSNFELDVPAGTDTAIALKVNDAKFDDGRQSFARAVIYVNGWNTGTWVGNVGPQSTFTIPSGFLNKAGGNTLAIALTTERDAQGPDSFTLVDRGTSLGGVPTTLNTALDYTLPVVAAAAVKPSYDVGATAVVSGTSALAAIGDGALTDAVVAFGDDSEPVTVPVANGAFSAEHSFAAQGTFTATATIKDAVSGAVLGAKSFDIVVAEAGTEPTDPATPTESAAPTETATPSESAAPSETATPSESASPTESTVPTDPAIPTESAVPTDPAAPEESAVPAGNATPAGQGSAAASMPAKPSTPAGIAATKDDLATTGANSTLIAGVAILLLAAGAAAVMVIRRRKPGH